MLELLTLPELSRELKLPHSRLYQLVLRGLLQPDARVNGGRMALFRERRFEEILALAERHKQK